MGKSLVLCFSILLLLLGTSCSRIPGFLSSPDASAVTLEIQEITPVDQLGHYQVQGITTLPEETRLTVSAIRKLTPSAEADALNKATFAILDREFVNVNDGRWQTELATWQIAPDGRYLESWQLDAEFTDVVIPDKQVKFLVTLEPKALTQQIDRQLQQSQQTTGISLVRYTAAGEPYIQEVKELVVSLPQGRAEAGTLQTDNSQTFGANRSENAAINELTEPPTIPFKETDNLPLPSSNRMQ